MAAYRVISDNLTGTETIVDSDTIKDKEGPRLRWAALLVPAVVGTAANLWHGAFIIDDTYIGLRYIENLVRGRGFVFNQGEAVLSISSPLYCLLLALLRWTGLDLEWSAVFLNVVFVAVMLVLVGLIALRSLKPPLTLALGLLIGLFPLTWFTANSGMETGMSMVAVYGTFLALFTGHWFWAGVAASVAVQVRPDGVLLIGLAAAYVALKDRRKLWQFLLPLAVLALPWLIYATATYGSPIPTSIMAKRANHATAAPVIIKRIGGLLLLIFPISIFSLVGMIRAARERSELLLIAAWMALYMAGLVAAGIDLLQFIWYFSPLAPGMALMAAYGIDGLAEKWAARRPATDQRRRTAGRAALIYFIALAAVFGALTVPLKHFLVLTGHDRVVKYLMIGKWINDHARPDDVVMVAECGALGYMLMDHYVLDQSGLNNPEVYEVCRPGPAPGPKAPPDFRPRFLTRECELALIRERRPDYIMTFEMFMHVGELAQDPWFRNSYRRVDLGDDKLNSYILLEKVR